MKSFPPSAPVSHSSNVSSGSTSTRKPIGVSARLPNRKRRSFAWQKILISIRSIPGHSVHLATLNMIERSGGRADARQAILQDVLARSLAPRGVGSWAPKLGPPVQTKNGSTSVFNSKASTVDVLTILDSLGRVRSEQTRQASGS